MQRLAQQCLDPPVYQRCYVTVHWPLMMRSSSCQCYFVTCCGISGQLLLLLSVCTWLLQLLLLRLRYSLLHLLKCLL
jgi:hypothetical protein